MFQRSNNHSSLFVFPPVCTPAELKLGWPAQLLTISVSHRHAITIYVALPDELGGVVFKLEVAPNHTVQHVLELALPKACAEGLEKLTRQPRLIAAHIPGDLRPETTLGALDVVKGDTLRVVLPDAARPVLGERGHAGFCQGQQNTRD